MSAAKMGQSKGANVIRPDDYDEDAIKTPGKVTNVADSLKVKSKGRLNLKRLKRVWTFALGIGILVAIITGVVVGYAIHQRGQNKLRSTVAAHYLTDNCSKQTNEACTKLKVASQLLDISNVAKLAKTIDSIKLIKKYDTDPNLLYVIIIYYINAGDAQNAHTYYDKFIKVYQSDKGYDASISSVAVAPTELKALVDFVDTQQAETLQNSFTVKEPK